MSEPALKCENNACFKQIYPLKLFIAFKVVYSCCFRSGRNPDFREFHQKSLITSTTVERARCEIILDQLFCFCLRTKTEQIYELLELLKFLFLPLKLLHSVADVIKVNLDFPLN